VSAFTGVTSCAILLVDFFTVYKDKWPAAQVRPRLGTDKNTRVALYARSLQLNPGEFPSAVIVTLVATNGQFSVTAEDVRAISNSDLTQVIFRMPNNVAAGACTVALGAHTRTSNSGTIRIAS